MPHVILQQSNNISNQNSKQLFKQIHQLLADQLPTKVESCRSRLIITDDYVVAHDAPNSAFAHLEVTVLAGRTTEVLNATSKLLLDLLNEHLTTENSNLDIKMSVEIRNLSEHYAHC